MRTLCKASALKQTNFLAGDIFLLHKRCDDRLIEGVVTLSELSLRKTLLLDYGEQFPGKQNVFSSFVVFVLAPSPPQFSPRLDQHYAFSLLSVYFRIIWHGLNMSGLLRYAKKRKLIHSLRHLPHVRSSAVLRLAWFMVIRSRDDCSIQAGEPTRYSNHQCCTISTYIRVCTCGMWRKELHHRLKRFSAV